MRPLPLAETLWDASHLHHNYSERLGKLVLAAGAVEAHRSASTRVDVFTRPRDIVRKFSTNFALGALQRFALFARPRREAPRVSTFLELCMQSSHSGSTCIYQPRAFLY